MSRESVVELLKTDLALHLTYVFASFMMRREYDTSQVDLRQTSRFAFFKMSFVRDLYAKFSTIFNDKS